MSQQKEIDVKKKGKIKTIAHLSGHPGIAVRIVIVASFLVMCFVQRYDHFHACSVGLNICPRNPESDRYVLLNFLLIVKYNSI